MKPASNNIILGSGEGATPVATTIRGAAGAGTNVTGANLTFDASNGTGSSGSGGLIFRTAAGSTGTVPSVQTSVTGEHNAAGGATLNLPSMTTSGSNRVLLVGVNISGSGTVSSVTFNGAGLNFLAGVNWPGSGRTELWILRNVAAATAAPQIILSAARDVSAGAAEIVNADINNDPITTTASGSSGTASATLSGTNTNQLVFDTMGENGNAPTVGGGQSQLWNTHSCCTSGSTASTKTGVAGATPMSWTMSSTDWSMIVAAINPVGGSGANTLTERLRIDQNGNIGVGTSLPTARLQVAGANTTTAFQVQNASGLEVLTADTSGGQVVLGKAGTGGVNGKLAFASTSASGFVSTISAAAGQLASWDYTLPIQNTITTGQCLQSGTVAGATVPLVFGSCGAGGSSTLAQAYAASAGAGPSIAVNSTGTGKAVTIQNSVSNSIAANNELFGIRATGASDLVLGASLFTVSSSGQVGINIGGTAQNPTPLTNFDLTFGEGANRSIGVNPKTSTGAGNNLTLQAGTANGANVGGTATLQGGSAHTTAGSAGGDAKVQAANGSATGVGGNGGNVQISAGNGLGTGPTNGGNVTLQGGSAVGIGTAGGVVVKNASNSTNTFQIQNTNGTNLVNVSANGTVNQIVSSDFENNSTNGWITRGSGGGLGLSRTQSQFGNYSLTFTTGGSSGGGVEYRVGLKPGANYTFSFWMKGNAGGAGMTMGRIESGSTITACTASPVMTSAPSTTWTQYTCTFTAAATISTTTPGIAITQTDAATDTVFIDGVSLTMSDQTTADNAFTATALSVEPYYNNVTVNGLNNGEPQPWTYNANALTAGRSRPAVTTYNGYIYVVGGGTSPDGASAVNSVQYAKVNADGSLGTFTASGNTLAAVNSGAGAVVANGYLYVIGGMNGNSGTPLVYNTVQAAKLNTDGTIGAFTTVSTLPLNRQGAGVITYNGYIYVVGGSANFDYTVTEQTVYYAKANPDGTVGAWTTNPNSLTYRSAGAGVVAANGYIYNLGGYNSTSSVEVNTTNFAHINDDGSVGTWSTTGIPTLQTTLSDFSAVVMNGYIYVIGGWDGTNLRNIVHYAPLRNDGTYGSWETGTLNILPDLRENAKAVVVNGYIYEVGGDDMPVATPTTVSSVLYASGPRLRVGGALDLVSVNGGNLSEGGMSGQLTAGNTQVVGTLQVQDSAQFARSVSVDGDLAVAGSLGVSASIVPTTDQVVIDNTGTSGVTTAGVNGLAVKYKGGAAAVEAAGMRIDFTPGTTTGGTWSGLRIVAAATGAVTGVTQYGLKLEGPTSPGAGTETGAYVGTGWDIGMDVQSGGIQLAAQTDPAAPAANNLRIYAKDIAGRIMPKWIGPAGVDTPFQANLGFNRVAMVLPGNGASCTAAGALTGFGAGLITNAGTCAFPTPASTRLLTSVRRMTFSSGTTAGTVAYHKQPVLQAWRGNAAGLGGFFYTTRFGTSTLAAGNRAFVGLVDSTANPTNVDPTTNTTPGKIGMAINANTGNWNIVNNVTGSAPTSTSLGANFPVDTTSLYELIIYSPPNGSSINYRVTNMSTGNQTSGSWSTNIPTTTTFLAPQFWITNNATAAAAIMDFAGWYLESDN